jgi:hypothetical protein
VTVLVAAAADLAEQSVCERLHDVSPGASPAMLDQACSEGRACTILAAGNAAAFLAVCNAKTA